MVQLAGTWLVDSTVDETDNSEESKMVGDWAA